MINYPISHYHQPTNNSCGQASLAMLLSYYGKQMEPEDIMKIIPVRKNAQGEDWGTLNQDLASWCLVQGFDVVMHSADFQILDTSWVGLSSNDLLQHLISVKGHRNVPSLGKEFSELYVQSYIDFITGGGELHVHQYLSEKLIDSFLDDGPMIVCVCVNVFYGEGRTKDLDIPALRQSQADYVNGGLYGHAIVVHGKNKEGEYMIADPWKEPGFYTVNADKLIGGMYAAQIDTDTSMFGLKPKSIQSRKNDHTW